LTVYLDASVLVSMFVADANTPRAWRLAELHPLGICSLWTIAEFSSALGIQVRMDRLEPEERSRAEERLDQWLGSSQERVAPVAEDFVAARRMLLDGKVGLRTPDALHLAICSRVGADLASFDKRMLQAAAEFRVTLIEV
jgi:hypothetical protein